MVGADKRTPAVLLMVKSHEVVEHLVRDECGPFTCGLSGSAWNGWEFEDHGREGKL